MPANQWCQKWLFCKGYGQYAQKWLKLGLNFKGKTKRKTNLILCKRRLEKHLIFEKWHDFEKWKPIVRQYGEKWLILGLDLKVPKTYKKTSLQSYLSCFI